MSHEKTPPAPDLRTRRRLETQGLIHQAAVDLFEAQGVKATTVEDISARAGVSSRTFFRHFATKEQAALPGQRRLREAIDQLEVDGSSAAAALRSVEVMAERVIDHEPVDELREHRRIRLLLVNEPDLMAVATVQEQALVHLLRDRLLAGGGPSMDRMTARLTAEVAMLIWRSCWDHWAELAGSGAAPAPTRLYADYRRALHRILA